MDDENELMAIIQSHIRSAKAEAEVKAKKEAEEKAAKEAKAEAEAKAKKEFEEAKAREKEERLAREKEQEEMKLQAIIEEKQKSFAEFYDYVLPKVTEHFKKSRKPLTMKALAKVDSVYRNKPKFVDSNSYDPKDHNFRITDKQVFDGDDRSDQFHLEGDLEKLGLGEGHSILLEEILDERMKSLLRTDPNNRYDTTWRRTMVFEDWAFFYGRKVYSRNSKDTRVIIGRLEDGQMKFKHDYIVDNGYINDMRLGYWGCKTKKIIRISREVNNQQRREILFIIDDNNELIPYRWASGPKGTEAYDFPLVVLYFSKSIHRPYSEYWDKSYSSHHDTQYRIAFFPDMSVMLNKKIIDDLPSYANSTWNASILTYVWMVNVLEKCPKMVKDNRKK